MKQVNKSLAALSYLLFFPCFLVVLTNWRMSNFEARHAAQAFFYWMEFLLALVLLRSAMFFLGWFGVAGIFSFILFLFFWFRSFKYTYLALKGRTFKLFLIGDWAQKLV